MTKDEKLAMLRALAGEEFAKDDEVEAEVLSDGVLSAYLLLAGQKIINKAYPFAKDGEVTEVPAKYEMLQIQIAAYMCNRRFSEGETRHIEVGTQRDYASADVPDDMLSSIVPRCGIPGR